MSWVNRLSLEVIVPSALLWKSVTICHLIPLRMNRMAAVTPKERELVCMG